MRYSEIEKYVREHPQMAGIHEGRRALAGPEEVWLDLTNRCNTRCICCPHRSPGIEDESPPREWHLQEMELERARGLVRELAGLGARRIFFSGGGEPLLHAGVFDVITLAQQLGVSALLTTNFLAADEGSLERILDSGLDRIVVSLLGASPETYAADWKEVAAAAEAAGRDSRAIDRALTVSTVVLSDERKARANIGRMADRARAGNSI